jgi:hypothetical protein
VRPAAIMDADQCFGGPRNAYTGHGGMIGDGVASPDLPGTGSPTRLPHLPLPAFSWPLS